MRLRLVRLLSARTFADLLRRAGTKWSIALVNALMLFALGGAYVGLTAQRDRVADYGHEVREHWEQSPEKHPHRMSHYGYVAFRRPGPLSFFDQGIERYVGNAVFLEAHRQNTANFSEASLSTGLMRFGELSGALLLQALLPLLIFFWGFSLVAGEREDGTLRLVFAQGVTWSEVIVGKSLGLFGAALTVLLPAVLVTTLLLAFSLEADGLSRFLRLGLLSLSYGLYLFTVSLVAIWVSTVTRTAKGALMRLIGLWLLFVLVLPKVSQVAGQVFYPTPSKVEFDVAVEHDLREQGDSHNPDDPYFEQIKDSVLAAHRVASTDELPFNYAGFLMREGEKLSTQTFLRHERRLVEQYERQHAVVRWTALINPYVAIKYVSMALAGTDFQAYRSFQTQVEAYRYGLAQTMNQLQIDLIGNNTESSADKSAALSSDHWADLRDFRQRPVALARNVRAERLSLLALGGWAVGLTLLALFVRKPASVL